MALVATIAHVPINAKKPNAVEASTLIVAFLSKRFSVSYLNRGVIRRQNLR